MVKVIFSLLGFIGLFFLNYWVLTEAWGLEMKNISAFILYVIGNAAIQLFIAVLSDD